MSRKYLITIGWDDLDDAESVAVVLNDAATRGAEIVDHGFYDDAKEIWRQVEKARRDEDWEAS
jgi:hypothetical protein